MFKKNKIKKRKNLNLHSKKKYMKKMNQISLNLVLVVCKDGELEWKIHI